MMVNLNYSEIITKAKADGVSQVSFKNNNITSVSNSSNQDTLTLSNKAISLSKGENYIVQEIAPIYVKPQTAAALLSENKDSSLQSQTISNSLYDSDLTKKIKDNSRFEDIMQAILDKRLGVDRKRLDELDAMMEEIAKNENLSPEEKAKAMEVIEEMREKIIEESIEVKKVAKQNHPEDSEKT